MKFTSFYLISIGLTLTSLTGLSAHDELVDLAKHISLYFEENEIKLHEFSNSVHSNLDNLETLKHGDEVSGNWYRHHSLTMPISSRTRNTIQIFERSSGLLSNTPEYEYVDDLVGSQRKKANEILSALGKDLPSLDTSVLNFKKNDLSEIRNSFNGLITKTKLLRENSNFNQNTLVNEFYKNLDGFERILTESLGLISDANQFAALINVKEFNELLVRAKKLRSERRTYDAYLQDSIALFGQQEVKLICVSFTSSRWLSSDEINKNIRESGKLYLKWESHTKERIEVGKTLLELKMVSERGVHEFNQIQYHLNSLRSEFNETFSYLERYKYYISNLNGTISKEFKLEFIKFLTEFKEHMTEKV